METQSTSRRGARHSVAALLALSLAAPLACAADEPEVVITPREEGRIKEYRVNGALYMIEVRPAKGPAYFLIDVDGDGVMETRRHNLEADVLIPHWTILRWK